MQSQGELERLSVTDALTGLYNRGTSWGRSPTRGSAERIRAGVAAEEFSGGKMTVSIGVAEYPAHGDTPEELIASADAAMYQAKGAGRDRVVTAGGQQEREKEKKKRRRKGET